MRLTRPKPFTLYGVGLFGIAAGMAVALFAVGQDPPLEQVLILGCLFAIAENTGVEFAEESGISASLMLAVASIVCGPPPATAASATAAMSSRAALIAAVVFRGAAWHSGQASGAVARGFASGRRGIE